MQKVIPKVSVIVPNYMHADYLNKRLESISRQSFQDFEVILLDDASTDKSEVTLKKWAKNHKNFQYFPNKKNSGSTFAQWNKGVELARGEYLWIAESDDWAEPDLLEKLVLELERNQNAVIAFSQSMLVEESGKHLHNFNVHYHKIFKTNRWNKSYVNNGINEIENFMLIHNIIPNASAALIRKRSYDQVGGAPVNWKLNGDWMFYIKLLENGDICYIPETLNYFRVHDKTQRSLANKSGSAYKEILTIIDHICTNHSPQKQNRKKAYSNVASWWSHSLYRQSWKKEDLKPNLKINFDLFRRFVTLRPLILLHIPYEGFIRIAVFILDFIGLKAPLRKLLHKLFPSYFIPNSI